MSELNVTVTLSIPKLVWRSSSSLKHDIHFTATFYILWAVDMRNKKERRRIWRFGAILKKAQILVCVILEKFYLFLVNRFMNHDRCMLNHSNKSEETKANFPVQSINLYRCCF